VLLENRHAGERVVEGALEQTLTDTEGGIAEQLPTRNSAEPHVAGDHGNAEQGRGHQNDAPEVLRLPVLGGVDDDCAAQ
jgi:hypothetical protein